MIKSRSKPIARKRATPRKVKTECEVRTCHRAATTGPWCRTHAIDKADKAWSAAVRTGECELAEWHSKLPLRCGQKIQGCHGISRGHLGTKYLLENGFSGCDAVNQWAYHHPADWDRALRFQLWGEEKYARLWAIADGFGKRGEFIDYAEIVKTLGGEREAA